MGTAESTAITPMSTVVAGLRSATWTKGAYTARIARDTGCVASGRMLPCRSRSRSAGATVTERSAAESMTKVLVRASGRKSRPA
jgi:hypothetical protein